MRTMALSMASEAPCPELEDGACAESPARTIRPRLHTGTRGMFSIDPTISRLAGSVWLINRAAWCSILGELRREQGQPLRRRGLLGRDGGERLGMRQVHEPHRQVSSKTW